MERRDNIKDFLGKWGNSDMLLDNFQKFQSGFFHIASFLVKRVKLWRKKGCYRRLWVRKNIFKKKGIFEIIRNVFFESYGINRNIYNDTKLENYIRKWGTCCIFLETSESHTAFEKTQLEGRVCCFHGIHCRFANVYYFKTAAFLEQKVSSFHYFVVLIRLLARKCIMFMKPLQEEHTNICVWLSNNKQY